MQDHVCNYIDKVSIHQLFERYQHSVSTYPDSILKNLSILIDRSKEVLYSKRNKKYT